MGTKSIFFCYIRICYFKNITPYIIVIMSLKRIPMPEDKPRRWSFDIIDNWTSRVCQNKHDIPSKFSNFKVWFYEPMNAISVMQLEKYASIACYLHAINPVNLFDEYLISNGMFARQLKITWFQLTLAKTLIRMFVINSLNCQMLTARKRMKIKGFMILKRTLVKATFSRCKDWKL